MKKVYKILAGKLEGKRPVGRFMRESEVVLKYSF
jgi:hypothetical protein